MEKMGARERLRKWEQGRNGENWVRGRCRGRKWRRERWRKWEQREME